MKKVPCLFLAFLLLIACLPLGRVSALAATDEPSATYAVAAMEGTYFYKSPSENSGLFIIPHTYYVKILNLGDPFCAVEYHTDEYPYQRVSGYCKKEELTFVDFVPARPYLNKQISVRYTLPEQEFSPSGSGSLDSVTVNYAFYGEFPVGSTTYHYVYGNGAFGYVPAQEKISYELNTDFIKDTATEEAQPPATDSQEISGVTFLFLGALALSALVVAFFVLRGKKSVAPPSEDLEF